MNVNAENVMPPVRVDDLRDADRRFVLSPDNNDVFVKTGRQVLAACQFAESFTDALKIWQGQVRIMLEAIADWAEGQGGRVQTVAVVGRGSKIIIMLLPEQEAFDFDLAEASADLDYALGKLFPAIGDIDVRQVPAWDWQQFMTRDEVVALYGQPLATSSDSVAAQPQADREAPAVAS